MKPRTKEDWSVVLDAIEWFQQQIRAKTPDEVREWIAPTSQPSRGPTCNKCKGSLTCSDDDCWCPDCAQPERQGADITRYERTAHCLMLMMQAYERRIRSLCNTPEELANEPWRCGEYVEAEAVLKNGWTAHRTEMERPSPPQDDIVAGLRHWLCHDETCKSENNDKHVGAYPCDCGLDRAIAALGEKGWQRNHLRRLVDDVWQAATDSQEVPSVSWADEIIDKCLPAPPVSGGK